MAAYGKSVSLLLGFIIAGCRSQLELDERFLEYRKDGMWLIEFYAPWCGHCKKLEPVYQEVAKELQQAESSVRVAKLDCTKYSSVASEFSIRGFPTIMFIKGDRVFNHRGDRTKEDIVEFALRAQGPTVRKLSSIGKFQEALKQHSNSVFFLYIGDGDEQEDLYKMYSSAADSYATLSYFYQGSKHIVENLAVQRHPTVIVLKDKQFYEYEPTVSSLEQFISREKHATFPRTSASALNEMAGVVKFLVILTVDTEDHGDSSTSGARLLKVVEELAFSQRNKFHSQFQFVWMDNTETVNNIAMSFLSSPVLMVLETEGRLYYMPPDVANMTVPGLTTYLTSIEEGKEQAYGGTGILMRLKSILFDILSMIVSMWQASRWLFLLMVGLPTAIISILCYGLCCLEPSDDLDYEDDEDKEYDDEDDEDGHLYDTSLSPVTQRQEAPPPFGDAGKASMNAREQKKNE